MKISIKPKKVFKKLLGLIVSLIIANIVVLIIRHFIRLESGELLKFGRSYITKLIDLFDFNAEANIPTLFSSLLLILCAFLLFLIGGKEKNEQEKYLDWYGLSLIFIFLSIDEIGSIHELLIPTIRRAFDLSGLFYFAWVIPYGALVLLFLVVFYKFIRRLPPKTAKLFILSGLIYVTGALIIEMPEGLVAEKYGHYDPLFVFLYTFEETLEMLGLSLFIFALTSYRSFTIKID